MSLIADPFVPVIVNLLTTYSGANGLGWTVIAQNSPNRKEWNDVPLVLVTPSPKSKVDYICFGKTKTVNEYDLYLIETGDLASNFTNNANNFYQVSLSLFMPQVSAMTNAGAYMTRVMPKYDYDRQAYPKGYISSCVNLNVYNVNQ